LNLRGTRQQDSGEDYITESSMICTSHQTLIMPSHQKKLDRRNMWHVCGKEGRLGIWRGDLKKRDHINDLVLDRRITLEWILKAWEGRHGLA